MSHELPPEIDAHAEMKDAELLRAKVRGRFKFDKNVGPLAPWTLALGLAIAVVTVLLLIYLWHLMSSETRPSKPARHVTIHNPQPLQLKEASLKDPSSNQAPQVSQAIVREPSDAVLKRRLQPDLQLGSKSYLGAPSSNVPMAEPIASAPAQGLAALLEAPSMMPSQARTLSDRNYLLTQGAVIDCQLENRLITTQPGFASCYLTRNIYSSNGRVILLDKGSKVVGHYQGGLSQGQARIFVLWTRAETPKGVVIDLNASGAGPLGESGLGGRVDTHFWQRFGGAMFVSLVGDLGDFAAQSGNRVHNGTNIQLGNTVQGLQEAVTETLRHSLNIPPTLYKNQGERITILVARDLDFRSVYQLRQKR